MKKNLFGFVLLSVLVVLLSACGTTPTTVVDHPVVTTAAKPVCSIIADNTTTMTGVLSDLGLNYYSDDPKLLINGQEADKNSAFQPGDFIVLADPLPCEGNYISARQVHFDSSIAHATWREESGFVNPITVDRLYMAFTQLCGEVRQTIDNAGFNGDLATGGCNYTTFVKMSRADGSTSCQKYDSMSEAYDSTTNLDQVKWIAIFSIGNTDRNFCE